MNTELKINESFTSLQRFCELNDFKGWDPYDGLNSDYFKKSIFKNSAIIRLFWIQLFKRSPINFRNHLKIEKEYNPKGLAHFLTGYCNLYSISKNPAYLDKINFLAEKLIDSRSKNFSNSCWGYNFDWQSRAFFLPKHTPTVVATSFAVDSLLSAFDVTQNQRYLDVVTSSPNFILKDLNRSVYKDELIFSYSPLDQSQIYNASLLGSKLLSKVYFYTKKEEYLDFSYRSVKGVIRYQNEDGSWYYGSKKRQKWIDSFHTSYNLECIYEFAENSKINLFKENLNKGINFYLKNFFYMNEIPKYYHDKIYPIDIHSPAQFIVSMSKLKKFESNKKLIDSVLLWTIKNMQDNQGFFYYQLKKPFSSKIPYMRWAQAWMFYAFSYYFKEHNYEL